MKSLLTARGNPYVTMVWLAIAGSFMLFLFLILLFLARTKTVGWIPLELPPAFAFSSICIVMSSFSLHFSRQAMKREDFTAGFYWLSLTLLLALSFALLQYAGVRIFLNEGKPNSHLGLAFAYLFSGLHFLHIVLGFGALIWVWNAFRKNLNYVDAFILNLDPITITIFRTATIFWHFLGILWIFLFLVLWSNQP